MFVHNLLIIKIMKWTQEQIDLLKHEWPTATTEQLLLKFPNRTYKAISEKARKLNISANNCRKKKGDLSFLELTSLTKETAYWWGFIMADGLTGKSDEENFGFTYKELDTLIVKQRNLTCTGRIQCAFTEQELKILKLHEAAYHKDHVIKIHY